MSPVTIADQAGLSDAGRKRRRNEDSFVVDPPFFVVADGMGGAQAGEVASRLAAAAFRDFRDADELGGEERVAATVQEANRRIYERAREDADASGMGTTVTAALLGDETIALGHVGRLAGIPHPGRRARAAHRRPLPRRRARADRTADARGGGHPSAALGDHAGPRHRSGRGRGHLRRRARARRRLPALLGRPDDDGPGAGDPAHRRRELEPRQGGPRAGEGREPLRRGGQHHGRPLLGRGRAGGRRRRDRRARRHAGRPRADGARRATTEDGWETIEHAKATQAPAAEEAPPLEPHLPRQRDRVLRGALPPAALWGLANSYFVGAGEGRKPRRVPGPALRPRRRRYRSTASAT